MWYEKRKKFVEGVKLISLNISDEEFEAALKKYFTEIDDELLEELPEIKADNGTDEEILLIRKTIFYIVQRLRMFLLSPVKLQSDLSNLGLSTEKSQIVTRLYSESARCITSNMNTEESLENETSIKWEVKTTLQESNFRCKQPIAQLSIKTEKQEITFDDLNKADLTSLFDKFETIQKELDVLSLNKK